MAKSVKNYFETEDPIRQNKIEDLLSDDEEIFLRLKPNRKDFILESFLKGLPFVLIWLGFDVFAIIMMLQQEGIPQGGMIGLIIGFFALHLLPVWLYVAQIVKRLMGYKNIEYVFTNQRIIIRSGLIGIDFKMLYYADIQSVVVKVGVLDRLFKVGDIMIKCPSQSAVLEDINDPYRIGDRIQRIILDLKTDIQYPNDLRPKENHGYKTQYRDENK